MRGLGGGALLIAAVVLAGCTGTSEPTPSITVTHEAGGCPAGTTTDDGFCLSDDPRAAELAAVVRDVFEADDLGAVIAGVWHDGDPVLVGALGESMTGVPATPDMHHLLGNLTTPMFTTVVLQQVEAGVLSLDDPLSDWFPDIPGADQVTIEMLLLNTSGYAHYTEIQSFLDELWADPFRHWEPRELVDIGVGAGTTFTPGTDWLFSDTNTEILTMVVEKATGRTVADLMQEGVFEPLRMTNTTAAMDGDWPSPVLHGYSDERGVWEDVTNWSPTWTWFAGGVGSNQDDVRVFLDALGSGELLSDDLHAAQFAPATVGLGSFTDRQYWGMGAVVLDGWIFLNPGLSGYFGAGGTLPDEGWTMVVYTTTTQGGDQSKPSATDIFRRLTGIVSPDHSLVQG